MTIRPIAALLLLVATTAFCEEPLAPTLTGYVTRFTSSADFDVNGKHVLLGPRTQVQKMSEIGLRKSLLGPQPNVEYLTVSTGDLQPYLGERMEIYGETSSKTHAIAANRIVIHAHDIRVVFGLGVVDAVLPLPAGLAASTDQLIRADGYPVLITAKSKVSFDKPLSSPSDIHVNVWMAFHGTQRSDGVVVADAASFKKNTISHSEDSLRQKTEYDPATVNPNLKQPTINKAVLGTDPKYIPPYNDQAMQSRIDSIGAKLVPKYQFEFQYTEETRIDFRFQLVDSPKWPFVWALPSGIILVPRQAVERMQNDSQLAAVLADSIASVLEKQPFRADTKVTKGVPIATAGVLAGVAGGLIVWGVSDAVNSGNEKLREEQSGRVSLALMHDAGYDLSQAPLAWQLLYSKTPQNPADAPVRERALYLYQFLGETWPPSQPAMPPAAPAAPQ